MSDDHACDMLPSELTVWELLSQAGVSAPFQLRPVAGGRNNRVFRVEAGATSLLLKRYFHHPDDPRDRLATEWAWTTFCNRHGITSAPRPLACDFEKHLGLFEFIDGDKLTAADVRNDDVEQALQFVRDVNQLRNGPESGNLPIASEACFSLEQHLACVEYRLQRLQIAAPGSEIDERMHHWLNSELLPVWKQLLRELDLRRNAAEDSLSCLIGGNERCLSPSDFGFHNALRERSGRLRFLDFEYAGWDDPAKLVCDFFNQIEVPAPFEYCERFVAALGEEMGNEKALARRVAHLLPVYRVKWCCIVLNDFLPTSRQRREFAGSCLVSDERKCQQLAKAEGLLSTVDKMGAMK